MGKLLNSFIVKEGERQVFSLRGENKEVKVYKSNEETQLLIKSMMLDMKSKTAMEWTRLFFKNLTNINEVDPDVLEKENFRKLFEQEWQPLIFREINTDINEIIERESEQIGKTYSKVSKLNKQFSNMSEEEQSNMKQIISEVVDGKIVKLKENKEQKSSE